MGRRCQRRSDELSSSYQMSLRSLFMVPLALYRSAANQRPAGQNAGGVARWRCAVHWEQRRMGAKSRTHGLRRGKSAVETAPGGDCGRHETRLRGLGCDPDPATTCETTYFAMLLYSRGVVAERLAQLGRERARIEQCLGKRQAIVGR